MNLEGYLNVSISVICLYGIYNTMILIPPHITKLETDTVHCTVKCSSGTELVPLSVHVWHSTSFNTYNSQ